MTRSYNERRNHQVIVLVERRNTPPKDVPRIMALRGFIITYENVRQIIRRWKKCHNNSEGEI